MLFRTLVHCCVCAVLLAGAAQAETPALSATEQTQLSAIAKDVFKSQAMPPDLVAMCVQQLRRDTGKKHPGYDAWADMGAVCLTPRTAHEPRDTSYLNEKERQNPDIAANVKATHAVMSQITFAVKTDNGDFLGYWESPRGTPLALARIVRYDTEGQFSLEPGRTITEALLLEFVSLEEKNAASKYQRARKSLEQLGAGTIPSTYSALNKQILSTVATSPDAMHDQLFKRYRAESK
ncbi:hypothetical protein [Ottowia thiooxydans]|uniref:hypothetical protein n=1 Tax=Ottowia thiooxydans TaxID=219182 RepID=UPI0004912CDD|nr:hypothetical protein [Ottowia thiooxydans]